SLALLCPTVEQHFPFMTKDNNEMKHDHAA
ncbi:unnamed protein product, partial [Rotaria sp. Silwood1]